MQSKHLTRILLTVGFILASSNQTVIAHTIGNGILGSTAAATDYYQIDCTTTSGNKTHHVFANIQDKSADANVVGLSVFSANASGQTKAYTAFDSVGGTTGPAAASSPNITIIGGEGLYNLAVFKTASSAQQYSITAHCEDINGTETSARGLVTTTPSTLISNQ